MRTLGIIGLCVVLLIGGAVAWVKFVAYPDYTYRYRLTLAVEIDGKVYTGSSVIEVIWNGGIPFGDVGPYYPSVRGQAVFIDLERHGVITTSLVAPSHMQGRQLVWPRGIDAINLVPRAFGVTGGNEVLRQLKRLTGGRRLDVGNMPRLVWFSNISDPKTAREISIGDISNVVGPNARLVDANVEITRDPVVVDIDKKLSWYKILKEPNNHGVMYLPDGFALADTMFIGDAS